MANQQLVHQNGDRLFVTSLDISNRFGKQHKHVMEAIRDLDCSEEFRRSNFRPSSYNNSQNKAQPMYEITRDGFTFLCMGFTGQQAALWKERYIAAFNKMEQALRQAVAPGVAPVPGVRALPGLKMTRQKERIAMEMFVAGHNAGEIGKAIGVSRTTACLALYGKYQFSPGSGAPECSAELIAAVAARHLTLEQERLAAAQERAAQRYLSSANNRALANALESVGHHLQQAPALALTALPKGGV